MFHVIYCSQCGKQTGLAVRNHKILKEMTYNCCSSNQKASEGTIKQTEDKYW